MSNGTATKHKPRPIPPPARQVDLVRNEADLLDRANDYGPPNKRFAPPFATLARYTRGMIGADGEIHYTEDLPFDQPAFSTGVTVPSSGAGKLGDLYLRRTTKVLYEKTGAATWTPIATLPSHVTNDHVYFVTPSGATKRITLAASS